MVFWTRSRIIAVCVISAIALVAIARPPHLPGVQMSEQAPVGKQDPPGKDSATGYQAERISVDTLRFVANGQPVTNKSSEAAGFVLVADRQLGAYLGLTPSSNESGEANDRKGHITRQGSALCFDLPISRSTEELTSLPAFRVRFDEAVSLV